MTQPITKLATRLERCERVIAEGLHTFVEVGRALREIRDAGLYTDAGFKTFEAYCRDRWEMSRRRAYQYIDAAGVVEDVHNCTHDAPANEAQARPLAAVPEEQRAEAWSEAVETAPDGKVTAKHVAEVAEKYREPKPEPEPFHPLRASIEFREAIERTIRKRAEAWPDDARALLPQVLRDLAWELADDWGDLPEGLKC